MRMTQDRPFCIWLADKTSRPNVRPKFWKASLLVPADQSVTLIITRYLRLFVAECYKICNQFYQYSCCLYTLGCQKAVVFHVNSLRLGYAGSAKPLVWGHLERSEHKIARFWFLWTFLKRIVLSCILIAIVETNLIPLLVNAASLQACAMSLKRRWKFQTALNQGNSSL